MIKFPNILLGMSLHEVWQSLRNTAEPPISSIYCLAKAFVSHTELHENVPQTAVSRRLVSSTNTRY
jgi:hypothetical protein